MTHLSDLLRIEAELQKAKDLDDAHFERQLSRSRLAQQRTNERIEHQDTEEV